MFAQATRDAVDDIANSRNRSTQHLLIGLGLTAGAVMASTLIARANTPSPDPKGVRHIHDKAGRPGISPSKAAFGLIWPPLFLALTLSGLRVWNAPSSPERTQALTLWGTVQTLNAVWMALGPRRLGGQLTAAVVSLGASAAYAWRARQVDAPAAGMVTPYVGWIGFANALGGDLWRRNHANPTLH